MADGPRGFRAPLLHCLDDPGLDGEAGAVAFHDDGLLVVDDGHILAVGDFADLEPRFGELPTLAYPGRLIVPGFVDCHVHYPQTDIIGAYGTQLLDWLDRHAFPAEMRFADPAVAVETAQAFLTELLRNGTTTALVFATSHKVSAEAIFEAALARRMRLIAGMVIMDRGAPAALCRDPQAAFTDSQDLIRRYGAKERLGYAVTPRFALSCTTDALVMTGRLLREHPGAWLHTHLSETPEEVRATLAAFPEACSYLDVYARQGLVTDRSVFAHGIWLDDADRAQLARCGCGLATCPTSNLFLGSGLFDLPAAHAAGVRIGLGTDVGGGTSLSMLATMAEAYKSGQMRGFSLDPLQAFYLATLGGARMLGLGDRIGSLSPGSEADFVVLDPNATPLMRRRLAAETSLKERLFALMVLADDRGIEETWVDGERAHRRSPAATQPFRGP
jgi:guanine deaminase